MTMCNLEEVSLLHYMLRRAMNYFKIQGYSALFEPYDALDVTPFSQDTKKTQKYAVFVLSYIITQILKYEYDEISQGRDNNGHSYPDRTPLGFEKLVAQYGDETKRGSQIIDEINSAFEIYKKSDPRLPVNAVNKMNQETGPETPYRKLIKSNA